MKDLICYCFNYTRDDIKKDFSNHGKSILLEKIKQAKKSRGCDCQNKNPRGR